MKQSISSATYAEAMAGRKSLSPQEKTARLQSVVTASGGINNKSMMRIGQGMIGPIQIRLRYEGLVRTVLVEDTLERGPIMPYDILDDLGIAYRLNVSDGEVQAHLIEGKQATPDIFRVSAFPKVKKQDLYQLRVNAVEYAQDEARQAIQKNEDHYLFTLLESAIVDRGANAGSATGGIPTGRTAGPVSYTYEKTVIIGAGSPVEPNDFYDAAAMIELEQLEASTVLTHPQDIRDLYSWDTNTTGWKFKDEVVNGRKITQYGEFTFLRSIMCPQGEQFLVCDPNFVGVFPVYYSLNVEENHKVEDFHKGWVLDEMVGMVILNPRGLARIVKTDSRADIGTVVGSAVDDPSTRGSYA